VVSTIDARHALFIKERGITRFNDGLKVRREGNFK
jgi:hypothetical protein